MVCRSLLALMLFAAPAAAFPATVGDTPEGGSAAPDLARGANFIVSCAKVDKAAGVQVVVYPGREDTSSGVAGVLVSDPSVSPDAVHIQMPDIPDLKGHVVRVKVFFFDDDGKHACDGGRYHLL